jgi:drug/metabolite transporter (DMT)-like permease
MISARSNARGIGAMLFATASFIVCDSFMKLVTEALPPFEVLFLRGIAASVGCGVLLLALGQWGSVARGFSKGPLLRGSCETASTLCYIVALSRTPIADVVAIIQTAPLILILLVALIWRERVGPVRIALIMAGFVGALLVAQPDASGFSPAALLAFAAALGVACRDLASRAVPAAIPALAVTFSTCVICMLGGGVMMLLNEDIVAPSLRHVLYLLGSACFITIGQFAIFMAYRLGAPGVIAPFFYSFAVWAVVAGLVVFHELPNALAILGIAAIVTSGLGIILLDRRKMREPVPAASE